MKNKFQIRPMQLSDMHFIYEWATVEGWNPGVAEGPAYFALDSGGLFVADVENRPVASIFGVNVDENLSHMGCYLVETKWRRQGLGFTLFSGALARLENKTIGCDGVLHQRETYERQGFRAFAKSYRLRFKADQRLPKASCDLLPIFEVPLADISALDSQVFGTNRFHFLNEWIRIPGSFGIAAIHNSQMVGFGHIRPSQDGYRVGPLVADSAQTASDILYALCARTKASMADLDVCAENPFLESFIRQLDLKEIFETVRMYRGAIPKLDWQRNFAMACMEVG